MVEQDFGSLAAVLGLVQKDVLGFLAHHFAAFNLQGGEGNTWQLVAVLGNQHTIVNLPALKLGVGVAADDEIIVRKLLCQFHIHLIAHMGQQDIDIALIGEPFILWNYFLGLLKGQSLHVVGARVGDA